MAKAKKQANAAPEADAATAETITTSATVPVSAPAPQASFFSGFISKPVLFLGLFVGLLSLAVDYVPAPITPQELDHAYSPRTLEQQQRYNDGPGRVINSSVFDTAEIVFDNQAFAAEDLVVSPDGKKAVTGLRDGRVVYFTSDDKTGKLQMFELGRTGNNMETCGAPETEMICGRPLGLAFVDGAAYARYVTRIEDPTFFAKSTMLLIADAYKGLILMDAFGKSTKIFDSVGPRHLKFLNSIAVTKQGEVFLSESSRRFHRKDVALDTLERQHTGRLLHFNPTTTRVSVLAKNIAFPNGIKLVDDEKALLVSLTFQNKIAKFDIKTKEFRDFAFLPGMPDNLWIDDKQTLFVGLVAVQPWWHSVLLGQPKVRKLLALAVPPRHLRALASPRGAFATVDLKSGDITSVYEDKDGSAAFLSGVVGFGDYYYLTSWVRDNIVRIPKSAFEK